MREDRYSFTKEELLERYNLIRNRKRKLLIYSIVIYFLLSIILIEYYNQTGSNISMGIWFYGTLFVFPFILIIPQTVLDLRAMAICEENGILTLIGYPVKADELENSACSINETIVNIKMDSISKIRVRFLREGKTCALKMGIYYKINDVREQKEIIIEFRSFDKKRMKKIIDMVKNNNPNVEIDEKWTLSSWV